MGNLTKISSLVRVGVKQVTFLSENEKKLSPSEAVSSLGFPR